MRPNRPALRGAWRYSAGADVGRDFNARSRSTNAVRHASARHISVRLTQAADSVTLRIEDDGDGFDAGAVPADRFGLVGMRERARLLGGTLVIESTPGEGTAIDVRLPVPDRRGNPDGGDV